MTKIDKIGKLPRKQKWNVLANKVDSLIDFLNNSQQKEKETNCLSCKELCPTCGYYCLGKGGVGCIQKNTMPHSCSISEEHPSHNWIKYDREPGNTPIDICRDCPAHKYPDQPSKEKKVCAKGAVYDPQCKDCVKLNEDQPSKPSIREKLKTIIK